ncbi:MAG: ABC transporter permease [Mycoplasmoidaceae bacterium]
MENVYLQKKVANWKMKLRFSKSVFKLVNIQFIQSKFSFMFSFIFSLVLIFGLGYMNIYGFGLIDVGAAFMNVIVGIMTFQVLQTGIQILPEAIIEFKQSVILKRIGSTPIKAIDFVLIMMSYYFCVIFVQFWWIVLWTTLAFGFIEFGTGIRESTDKILGMDLLWNGNVDWFSFFITSMYTSVLAIVVGLFIASISKSSIHSQVIGGITFFITMFLSGNFISIQTIDSMGAMKYISLITPFRSVNNLTYIAWNSQDMFAVFQPWKDAVFPLFAANPSPEDLQSNYIIESWFIWYSWIMPIIMIVGLVFLSARFFKWSKR